MSQEIIHWARLGNLNKIKELISGSDIRIEGGPLLIAASIGGHQEVVKFLIDSGVDVDSTDDFGTSALMEACLSGQGRVAKLLLEKGASIDAVNSYGETALIRAAIWGQVEIAQLLLSYGADLNCTDNDGNTPLAWSIRQGHPELTELLINAGARVYPHDKYNRTALVLAAFSGHPEVVELLLDRGAEIEARDSHGNTALIAATKTGDLESINLLLERGADINATDTRLVGSFGWGLLLEPVKCGLLKNALCSMPKINLNSLVCWWHLHQRLCPIASEHFRLRLHCTHKSKPSYDYCQMLLHRLLSKSTVPIFFYFLSEQPASRE